MGYPGEERRAAEERTADQVGGYRRQGGGRERIE
jgi:hypothetical protein